ncbi:hypothetical protein QBC36DRAFT_19530 [Triangularia setosa]|uniref:Archaemetzincin-2 n=1 Tax=Triangularia setosa TaxID=2587417 RepID=A0AAN6WF08_9PEZI|nr:hypothetical protein QBC36DRAFT_19530 [Podospora setosa]
MAPCKHATLFLDVSPNAAEAGFTRPPAAKRRAATSLTGRRIEAETAAAEEEAVQTLAGTFPGPLVLPDDLLSAYPKDPDSNQSLLSWKESKHRNRLGNNTNNTIHLTAPPTYSSKMKHVMKNWTTPLTATRGEENVMPPKTKDLAGYLAAYYHPLPVTQTPNLSWVPWIDDDGSKGGSSQYIGLKQGANVTRIRTRPCPDGAYERQLNLSDILDGLLHMVGDGMGGYAVVMVVHHDLYEDEEDDFCCGRAYGGSRVAVVTSSRYHPGLDSYQGIERGHMWPASHCGGFVRRVCGIRPSKKRKAGRVEKGDGVDGKGTAMRAAVDASVAAPAPEKDLAGLWFGRTALTVSHELGHCFCLGHCNYYACAMQGTAGIVEDVRQPPYICLVCLEKVISGFLEVDEYVKVGRERLVLERYEKLYAFCTDKKRAGVKMFAGYGAWLGKRIETLKAGNEKSAEPASCIDLTNESE